MTLYLRGIIGLLCFLCCFSVFSQDTSRDRAIHYGFIGSPEYSFRKIASINDSTKGLVKLRDSIEIPKLGYSFGVFILYQINRRFSIELGALYSEKGERTINMDVIDTINISNPVTKMRINNRVTYIDFPLKLNYYFNDYDASPFVSIGFSQNIFAFNKYSYDFKYKNGEKVSKSNIIQGKGDYYRFNPQIRLGFGFDFILYQSRMRIEPSFAMSLKNTDKSAVATKFYSFGICLSYMLNMYQKEEKEF